MKRVISIVLVLMIAISMTACVAEVDYSANLEVLNAKFANTTRLNERVMVGEIRNNNEVDFELVLLSITLYDKDGKIVGSCADHVGYLGAGEIWKFQTTSVPKEAVDFKITKLEGRV